MDGTRRCQGRGLTGIAVMDAGRLGFAPASFDLVVASDVLEHIEDDAGALAEWRRVLKPRGRLLVLVPAFQMLWAAHDTVNRHHRRYTVAQLRRRLVAAELRVERTGYWNFALFLPILAVRVARRFLGREGRERAGDLRRLPELANRGLYTLQRAENRWLLRSLPFPVGVSAFAVASADMSASRRGGCHPGANRP
jgi:SAM-dependent methyltransferase